MEDMGFEKLSDNYFRREGKKFYARMNGEEEVQVKHDGVWVSLFDIY